MESSIIGVAICVQWPIVAQGLLAACSDQKDLSARVVSVQALPNVGESVLVVSGPELFELAGHSNPAAHVILIGSMDRVPRVATDREIANALPLDVTLAELLACIRQVSCLDSPPRRIDIDGGFARLTKREWEIVRLVCQGMKNREIAAALSLSIGTVKVHLMHIFDKTGVTRRWQLELLHLPSDT
ncbi:MAG: response regulator transcription factor [Candidatus Doudnabacteria bacterium]|nr:response regulator transcription factor [Candidatus Doudnabacteria bacterium]